MNAARLLLVPLICAAAGCAVKPAKPAHPAASAANQTPADYVPPASTYQLSASVWLDAKGNVTQAHLDRSSGNPEDDRQIEERMMAEKFPPPGNRKMPIHLHFTATQPAEDQAPY